MYGCKGSASPSRFLTTCLHPLTTGNPPALRSPLRYKASVLQPQDTRPTVHCALSPGQRAVPVHVAGDGDAAVAQQVGNLLDVRPGLQPSDRDAVPQGVDA